MAFINELRAAIERMAAERAAAAAKNDPATRPWYETISRLRGRPSPAGEEWITAAEVFDALRIPEPARASMARKVAASMRSCGWSAATVGPRTARRRGYKRSLRASGLTILAPAVPTHTRI
jgi:hypothetical protein